MQHAVHHLMQLPDRHAYMHSRCRVCVHWCYLQHWPRLHHASCTGSEAAHVHKTVPELEGSANLARLVVRGANTAWRCRGAKHKEELNRVLTSHIMLRRLKKDVLSQIPALQRSRISVLPDPRKLKVAHVTVKPLIMTIPILNSAPKGVWAFGG